MESKINFQMDCSNRISKAFGNYKKSPKDRITEEYVVSRLEILEHIWTEFITGHKELIQTSDVDALNKTSYVKADVYDTVEETYLNYKCELKTKLALFEKQNSTPHISDGCSHGSSNVANLPKVNIPVFSGKYTEWISFRDLFLSMIDSNTGLSKVQKLQYLKGYLVGEAEQLVRNIKITELNYDRCWSKLENNYNNKKYIANCILKRFFGQKSAINESASFLKELLHTSCDCLEELESLGIPVGTWDVIVIHILASKLDPETRKHWELKIADDGDELPSFVQFKEFLTKRFRALESFDPKRNSVFQILKPNKSKSFHVNYLSQCPFCKEDHKLAVCKQFSKEESDARRDFVQNNGICFNCLGSNHSVKYCLNNVNCRICKRRHHSLLHPSGSNHGATSSAMAVINDCDVSNMEDEAEDGGGNEAGVADDAANGAEQGPKEVISSNTAAINCEGSVLLATAMVKVKAKNGEYYTLRALIDQGSQASFISESAAQLLGLKKSSVRKVVSGLGGNKNTISKSIVQFNIQSCWDEGYQANVKAYVIKSVTSLLPSRRIMQINWPNPNKIRLADPNYYMPNKIDVLLGSEVYCKILREGLQRDPNTSVIAQCTSLGWILSGEAQTSSNNTFTHLVVMHAVDDKDEVGDLFKRFWEIESEPTYNFNKLLTEEEKKCEDFYAQTTRRDTEGRYIVKLPFKSDNPACTEGQTRDIALKRVLSTEKRLQKSERLRKEYKLTFEEYLKSNWMARIPEEKEKRNDAVYLPYHPIIREDKETTKVRWVYNASQPGTNGVSLNDDLLVGPTLQSELRHLIMRWRTHPITLVADIAKMFLQVKVDKTDAEKYQRILWRESTEINEYMLLRVTFGTASAPYLAVKSLMQVAIDEGDHYPVAAEKVFRDFYMDDLMTGCQNIEEGLRLYKEMNTLLSKGGFKLQKWSSNNHELLNRIREEDEVDSVNKELHLKTDAVIKILGVTWNRSEDTFQYTVTLPKLQEPVTKRRIISDISRLFDPLGWVAPSIILAKVIIQKLWLAGIEWDAVVPNSILEEWLTYREELMLLSEIRIPRWLGWSHMNLRTELHGYCDASKTAYAAVVYSRNVNEQGHVTTVLVTAKTKVAPIKQISIPRLELCGAVLLAKLLAEVGQILNIQKSNIHAWTDSTVVMAWINSHPSRWKTFVANRVSEILNVLDPHQWSHVSSKHNPADCASRGLRPSELLKTTLWHRGPEALRQEVIEYTKPKDISTKLEEAKVHFVSVEDKIWDKYSSLMKVIRIVAYCRRVLTPKGEKPVSLLLSSKEIDRAMKVCIREYQREHFGCEINLLMNNDSLSKKSKIASLNPFVDKEGLLRVGGRLEQANLCSERKHPVLLPKAGNLTTLIIADAHHRTLHGGPQLMLSYLITKYWIIGVKQLLKSHVRRCVRCVRYSAKSVNQLMGQLPAARVTPSRAFKKSGVDYAGPIMIRATKGRGHRSYKGYICLFVCMATRAVHIEVVSDCTAQGFLAAFRRFVARRGHCNDLYSDNGTNFIGASRELQLLFNSEKSSMLKEVVETLATNRTAWHFIPPHSPNFGGLWEAGVKSVKFHLRRVIGESSLTFEELATVLCQVEAGLNSRPLSRIESATDDYTVLTPGHFLIGESLLSVPDFECESSNISNLRRWQLMQRILQSFWRRWSREYLTQFLQRHKWAQQKPEPKEGDIVLIKEDDLPPCRWLFGKVVERHPGPDNLTRVVTLRTKSSVIKRPTSKICILPVAQ